MERICLEQRELKSGPHLSWTILNLANLPIGKENVHWGFSRSWKFIHKRIKLGHQHAESKCCQGSQQKKNVHRTGQWIWWSIWSLQRAGKTEEIVGVETAPKRARKLGNNKENHCTDDYCECSSSYDCLVFYLPSNYFKVKRKRGNSIKIAILYLDHVKNNSSLWKIDTSEFGALKFLSRKIYLRYPR